jgi:uncharacterized protein
MIHPDTELRYIDDVVGYGVVALKKIPKGTIVWVQDKFDQEFTPGEVEQMEPIYKELIRKYTFRNHQGNHILCWDFGRYVNHSFNSNCLTTGYEFEIAVRDIEPGEELTDDYGYLNITANFEIKGANSERKTFYPDDLLRYYKLWDGILMESIPFMTKVDQPLETLINAETWKEIKDIIEGRKEMRSILTNYYDPNFVS